MREAFLQALKWFFIALCVIGGIGCLYYADYWHSVRPVFPAILFFGLAFILGALWKDLRQKTLFISIVLAVGLAWAAQYVEAAIYIFLGRIVDYNYFMIWTGLAFAGGVPVMTWVFYKYGR